MKGIFASLILGPVLDHNYVLNKRGEMGMQIDRAHRSPSARRGGASHELRR